jgi:predicted DNA-binding ribbon-helix-helix protein
LRFRGSLWTININFSLSHSAFLNSFFGRDTYWNLTRDLASTSDHLRVAKLGSMPNSSGRSTMKSSVIKRSVVIASHKTSVSLEDEFWQAPKEVTRARGTTLSELVTSIDVDRRQGNLSSGLRLFVLDFYRTQRARQISANAPTELKVDGLAPDTSGSTRAVA